MIVVHMRRIINLVPVLIHSDRVPGLVNDSVSGVPISAKKRIYTIRLLVPMSVMCSSGDVLTSKDLKMRGHYSESLSSSVIYQAEKAHTSE